MQRLLDRLAAHPRCRIAGPAGLPLDPDPSELPADLRRFYEVYGVAGSMPVIAGSFGELLSSLLTNAGGHRYWLEPDWTPLGDAYD